jgi:hypothetical protein
VHNGDPTSADQATRIIGSTEALLVQPRTQTITVTYTGELRENSALEKLSATTSFIGSPWPIPQTPIQLGMNVGFTADVLKANADQIKLWSQDSGGPVGYIGYFLSPTGWVTETAPNTNVDNNVLFQPLRGVFITRKQAGIWQQPLPW